MVVEASWLFLVVEVTMVNVNELGLWFRGVMIIIKAL